MLAAYTLRNVSAVLRSNHNQQWLMMYIAQQMQYMLLVMLPHLSFYFIHTSADASSAGGARYASIEALQWVFQSQRAGIQGTQRMAGSLGS